MAVLTDDLVCSVAEFAGMIGITARRVQQLIQDGVLIRRSDGKMNVKENVGKYVSFIRRDQLSEEEADIEKKKLKAEADYKAYKAKAEGMKTKELEGIMHRSEDVEAITNDLIFSIRSSIVALPGRLAVDVADAKTASEAADIIRKEVNAMLKELSDYQYDPEKYEARVRERMEWEAAEANDG